MRILVFGLVLANLGLLAWTHWIAPPPAVAPPYDGPGMTLLRELDPNTPALAIEMPDVAVVPPGAANAVVAELSAPDILAAESAPDPLVESEGDSAATLPADAATALPVDTAAAPSLAACVAVGPFIDPDITADAAATLAAAGLEPAPTQSEEEVWDGYWVYVEQIESRAAANEILDTLADNGIEDAYMIPNSDSGILISIGVFSRIERASTVTRQVGGLGIEPTITERTRLADTTWFEVVVDSDSTDLPGLLQTPGQISRLSLRACR